MNECKIGLRKALLTTIKTARQVLTRSYRQRLKCLYVRLDTALLETRSSANSLECDQAIHDRPTSTILLRCFGKKGCGMSTIMAENQERATLRPAYVHSRRNFSSFLRAGDYQNSRTTLLYPWVAKLHTGQIGRLLAGSIW